jgi:hypothetical protein
MSAQDRLRALRRKESELAQELASTVRLMDERYVGDMNMGALDNLKVASPCNANWADMVGDERVRHCGLCDKKVFNLSAMTRREAAAVLAAHEPPCVRFYQRADGTLMTTDCPVGQKKKRVRLSVLSACAAVAAGTAAVLNLGGQSSCPMAPAPAQLEEAPARDLEVHEPAPPRPFMGAALPIMGGPALAPRK